MARRRRAASSRGVPPRAASSFSLRQPLDRWALAAISLLTVAAVLLTLSGDHASARVRQFSWQDHRVGAEDRAFLLTFSRPMDPRSVEDNLTITPPLPGRFSWAGRRMAYTLNRPVPYGETFTITLDQATDRFGNGTTRFQPFQGTFQARQRAFFYIGTEGEEAQRLVLADLTQQERQVLTPPDLVVLDFQPYPQGDRVLIAATDRATYGQGELNRQIYTVTTGFTPNPPPPLGTAQPRRRAPEPRPAGELTLVLDSDRYQNLAFDLAPNGDLIVVQRASRDDPADFGPWVLRLDQAPQRLETEPGGAFQIGPDSESLLLLQGEGTAILDLSDGERAEPLDFLPDYGQVLDVQANGQAAAMVNFNQDDPELRFTESLFLVRQGGEETPLLQVSGAIIDAQFGPANRLLYVLASEVVVGDGTKGDDATYGEQPFLTVIDLEAQTRRDLLLLPQQQQVHMSLAPDGLALLLDLNLLTPDETEGSPERGETEPLPDHLVWLIPLFASPADQAADRPIDPQPEPFPFQGVQATWLP